jgi:leader peptidase (prepilin peptidase)/N-methyltransferase
MPAELMSVLVLAAVVGLCIGSFLNVVIHRLPQMLEREWRAQSAELSDETSKPAERYNLVVPRSRCPACGHRLAALENIPVISYLFLRGHCRACNAPISARYPIVELLTAALTVAAIVRFGATPTGIAASVFLWMLVALTFIDFDTLFLPDNLTLPLLWAGLLANVCGAVPSVSLRAAVIGAIAGYLVLWLIYWAFKLIRGKEGMGYGDFKLLAALGAWLGWQMLPLIVVLSSVVGAAIGISLVLFKRHDRENPLPFGPYLAIAGAIALFFGKPLVALYLPG